ncbi:hypothetical protein [Leptospira interrogans]|uniref:hypothetical protein n=1 Tax=Leptospira interrogans TaxID=173 RepID=UPI000AAF0A52|nr:hypothetical protein [Leptospira interrogans]
MNKTKVREQYESLIFVSESMHKIKNQTARVLLHLSFEFMLNESKRLILKMEELQRKLNDPELKKEIKRVRFLNKKISSIEATLELLCIPKMRKTLRVKFPTNKYDLS